MIIEYHRPETMEQAKKLLSRSKPLTIPLGGGTLVSHPSQDPVAVVDLQALGLDKINNDESIIKIGAMVRLQSLVESSILPEAFHILLEERPILIFAGQRLLAAL
jgi:CO/xanthine dehydrogenase FAD-binding subunit